MRVADTHAAAPLPLRVELRVDEQAAPGDLVGAIAALVLERARRQVAGVPAALVKKGGKK
jgi:hypothetical protein